MGFVQNVRTPSSMMKSYMYITGYQRPRVERATTATLYWYTTFAINRFMQERMLRMSSQSREVRDLLERLEGRLSRAVLRGLRGSNAHSATRLLEKWHRHCAYCDAKDVPLQIEHIHPRARGGTNRVSNLTLACAACNRKKGTQDIAVFLKNKPDVLKKILAQAKAPLKDAAAVNRTRWALFERLKATGLPVECGSGGLTRYNRTTRGLAKAHWLDAACVGTSTPEHLAFKHVVPLQITANGHGSRQMCLMDRYGFVRTKPKAARHVHGFQTGCIVRAVVPSGAKRGTYSGRVAVRRTGSFNITTRQGTVQGISHRFCTLLQQCDGYSYGYGTFPNHPGPKKGTPVSSPT